MKSHEEIVKQAVIEAGGQTIVANHFGLRQPAVFKWTRAGLPRTDWTGETSYAQGICDLANASSARSRLWIAADLLVRDTASTAQRAT